MKLCFLILDTANSIKFDGSSYRCYSLLPYDSPFVEGETITVFVRNPSVSGTLMTGRQGVYQFSLYIRDLKLHYEALQHNQVIVRVNTASNVNTRTHQVNRNVSTVEIIRIDDNSRMTTSAIETITMQHQQELGSVQFTDICVGGGSINNPTYSDNLQSVYYNLHYLSSSGAVFEERTRVSRINLADPNTFIGLPGNLMDNRNIQLSFRTSQHDAMLLQVEDLSGYLYIFISNSQVYASLNISGITLSSHCSRVNITSTTWYRLVIESVVEGCDANCQVNIALAYVADGTIIDQCNLATIAVTILSSAPVVIGGMAGGVEGLMGCLELMVNYNSLNLEGVIDDNTIYTNDCGSCDIMPCLNGGTCVPLNDYEFNCSCVDPYFGEFCGECCYFVFLQNVYYNLHYLLASGVILEERARISRINLADPNTFIGLPGNLMDNRNIQLSFRTSQHDAMLLQVEDLSGYLYIFISNSQVYASLNISGITLSSHCSHVNITSTAWYRLVIESIVEGCDANCQVNIALAYAADGTIIDQCNLLLSTITILNSTSIMIGGVAGGVEGLVGCLELMVNFNSLNLEGIIDDNMIHTNDCGSCDIMPCLNGGVCIPLNDYEFNCSCVDPYFGDFCGECCIVM